MHVFACICLYAHRCTYMCVIHVFACMLVYTQVHMHVRYSHVHVCMLICTGAHASEEARSHHQVSFSTTFHLFKFEGEDRVSHLTLNSLVWQDMD